MRKTSIIPIIVDKGKFLNQIIVIMANIFLYKHKYVELYFGASSLAPGLDNTRLLGIL